MVTPKDQGYNFISQSPYLQQDFVPNVATFNISPNNSGIMGQYPQYPQYPIIPGGGGDGSGGVKNPGGKNKNFDYEFEALGGLNNPANTPLTEEEQVLMDQMRFGKALTPFQIAKIGFNPLTGIPSAIYKNAKQKKLAEKQLKYMVQSEETGRQLDAADKAFAETGDYDEYSGSGNTNQTYSTPAPSYSYEGSDEQDRDNENTSTGGRDESDRMAYGGRAGYSGEGLSKYEVFKLGELGYDTKGGKILEPFGGINVLRDILKVNKYAYGGIVGMYR
jgi:hypothetical protein